MPSGTTHTHSEEHTTLIPKEERERAEKRV
jgi:hypothetical protein